MTLAFACHRKHVPTATLAMIEERLVARTSVEQRTAYVAHMALRMVDWSIRHFTASETERWIDIAQHWRTWAIQAH